MKRLIVFCINLSLSVLIFAQPDSSSTSIDTTINTTTLNSTVTMAADTNKADKKSFLSFLKEEGNKPKKAAFYSVIFPGGGQLYNKQYWKAPIALGAVGTAGYFIYDNTTQYRLYRDAYRYRVDDDPTTIDPFASNPNATDETLVELRDTYRKWMEQSYIGFVVVYGLNVLEAYTAAHLKDFDIDDDLSLHWEPTVKMQNSLVTNSNMEFGVTMQFQTKTPNIILDF